MDLLCNTPTIAPSHAESPDSACAPVADPPRPARRRMRFGSIAVEVRRFAAQQSQSLTLREGRLVLVAALSGRAEWIGADEADAVRTIRGSTVALLARPGLSTLVWSGGAEGVILDLPRHRLQALVNARQPDPIRIAAVDALVDGGHALWLNCVRLASEAWDADPVPEADQRRRGEEMEDRLSLALAASPDWFRLIVAPRAIQHAVAAIRAGAEADLDPQALAIAAGVTLRTLREGFSACFGVSLAAYVQQARLARAQERLSSGYDSRSMQQVAEAAGFRTASTFSRAYRRMFDETPTQTRACAVRGEAGSVRLD